MRIEGSAIAVDGLRVVRGGLVLALEHDLTAVAAELYQRPQTEFVATFLGTGNLLAGKLAAGEVQVGPLRFPLATRPAPGAT